MMTYEAFRKAHPAKRNRQHYATAQTIERWSTPLRSEAWRNSTGEYFYMHALLPGRGYPAAKAATTAAYEIYKTQHPARIAGEPELLRVAPSAGADDLDGDVLADAERSAEEEAAGPPRRTLSRLG